MASLSIRWPQPGEDDRRSIALWDLASELKKLVKKVRKA